MFYYDFRRVLGTVRMLQKSVDEPVISRTSLSMDKTFAYWNFTGYTNFECWNFTANKLSTHELLMMDMNILTK